MIQIFMLNMTYDVPVKLFSFHLIVMSILLLAPDARRLSNLFFLNRTAQPRAAAPLFLSRRANRIALAVLALFWLWMLGNNIYGAWSAWHTYGGGRQKSALYGIWDVEQFTVDGQPRPPLTTDKDRWRRAIFDFTDSMQYQRMDDSFAGESQDSGTHQIHRHELEGKLRLRTSCPGSTHPGWRNGRPQGPHPTAPRGQEQIPVRQQRLPLGPGVPVQPLTS
jgi:hypothetical protein